MKKNRKKNILFSLILILTLFFGQFGFVQARSMGIKLNPVDMMDKILEDLGINKSSVQDAATTLNNAQNKANPPTVSITFAPANPKEGERITASAIPVSYMNDPEKLYYTWFLKTANCFDSKLDGSNYKNKLPANEFFTTDPNPSYESYKNNKCNLDGDNDVDIEDYKIKAMRIIASNEFSWEKADYDEPDHDNDNYKASFGGDDQSGKNNPQCFVNDSNSGIDYPISCKDENGKDVHLFPNAPRERTGDDSFGRNEERFWRTDPTSRSTGQNKNTDETNVCGLGIINFSWNYQKGDKVGVVTEGASVAPTQTADSTYKTMWAMSSKNLEATSEIDIDAFEDEDEVPVVTDVTAGGTRTITTVTTKTEREPDTDENGDLTNTGNIIQVNTTVSKKKDIQTSTPGTFAITSGPTTVAGPNTPSSTTDVVASPVITTTSPTITIALTQEEFDNYNNTHDDDEQLASQEITVSGTMVTTRITTTRTVIENLGPIEVDPPTVPPTYTGNYTIRTTVSTKTDETTSTTHSDFVHISTISGMENLETDDFDVTYGSESIARVSDLNKLLYKALISPSENSVSSEKLNVQLSYSPTFPLNDPLAKKGDLLSFNASASNAQDNSSLKYYWDFSRSDSVNEDDWAPILKADFPVSSQTQTEGLGLDSFKLKLDFPEKFSVSGVERNFKFLKAKLTIKEKVEGGVKEGRASVIIPIESSSGKIETYGTTVGADLSLSLGGELCSGDKITCQVTKSSIVGLSLSETEIDFTDFLWTVDGKNIKYKLCPPSINCNDSTENKAFFPITNEVGQKHTVNLVATNSDGDKIELNKVFQVVDPKIKIIPENILDNSSNCKRIVVGNFIDLDGNRTPDYSKTSLLSAIGSPIKIKADVIGFSPTGEAFSWNVNGNSFPGQAILELPAKEIAGDNYSVSVNVLYSQNNATKQALNKYWGISQDGFYEKTLSDKVDIVLQNPELVTQENSNKKIFASLSSSTPEYLAFLLRIILTTFLIVFVSKLIFIFSSETKE